MEPSDGVERWGQEKRGDEREEEEDEEYYVLHRGRGRCRKGYSGLLGYIISLNMIIRRNNYDEKNRL